MIIQKIQEIKNHQNVLEVLLKWEKKEKKHKRSSSCDEITSGKKVKINSKIEIIEVKCWKKYNLEQTANEISKNGIWEWK